MVLCGGERRLFHLHGGKLSPGHIGRADARPSRALPTAAYLFTGHDGADRAAPSQTPFHEHDGGQGLAALPNGRALSPGHIGRADARPSRALPTAACLFTWYGELRRDKEPHPPGRLSTGTLAEHPPSPRLRRTRTLGLPAAMAYLFTGHGELRRDKEPRPSGRPSHGHLGRASSFAKATEDKDARPSRSDGMCLSLTW